MADPVVTPDSSRKQLIAAYRANLDYDLVGSSARAIEFVKAARSLLSVPITRTSSALRSEEVELDPTIVERQLKEAVAWLRQNQAYANELPPQFTIDEGWRS